MTFNQLVLHDSKVCGEYQIGFIDISNRGARPMLNQRSRPPDFRIVQRGCAERMKVGGHGSGLKLKCRESEWPVDISRIPSEISRGIRDWKTTLKCIGQIVTDHGNPVFSHDRTGSLDPLISFQITGSIDGAQVNVSPPKGEPEESASGDLSPRFWRCRDYSARRKSVR